MLYYVFFHSGEASKLVLSLFIFLSKLINAYLIDIYVKYIPMQIHSKLGSSFFTLSQSELSRSPPKRRPPSAVPSEKTSVAPQSSIQAEQISNHKIALRKDEEVFKIGNVMTRPSKSAESGVVAPLGLPHLQTGVVLS